MKQHDWTEQLRQRLSDYEEPAPNGLWADIDRCMQRRARLVVLRRWMVGVAACALLLVGGWHLMKPFDTDLPYMANTNGTEIPLPSRHEVEEVENASQMIAKVERENEANMPANPPQRRKSVAEKETQSLEPLSRQVEEMPARPKVNMQDAQQEKRREEAVMAYQEKRTELPPAVSSTPATERYRRQKVSLQLHADNLMAYGGSTYKEPMLMTQSYMGNATFELSRKAPVYLSNHEEKVEHHRPLTVGLSFRLPLGERWWLASGATLSRTSSTFTQQMNSSILTNKQRLYYVGIPVHTGYTFWQKPRLQAYAGVGVEAQYNIKTEVDYGHLDRDRLQFSVLGSAGLEYVLLPHLSVYVQPGLRFYPDNGSPVQNIFKEKPWQLDMQLGLRLH